MTITQIIAELQKIKETHGDVEVYIHQPLDSGVYIETNEVITQTAVNRKQWVGIK